MSFGWRAWGAAERVRSSFNDAGEYGYGGDAAYEAGGGGGGRRLSAEPGHGLNIFQMPNLIDMNWFTGVMLGLIVVTVLFESLVHWVGHKTHGNSTGTEIVQKLKDELMVLGFISFFFVVMEQGGFVT